MRFLLSRRWLAFFLTVGVLAYGAWWLGQWQFNRLQDKHDDNARIQCSLKQPPVPIDTLLKVGAPAPKVVNRFGTIAGDDGRACSELGPVSAEWRLVTIHGHWDDAHTLVIKYQTDDDGRPGVRVATPLITPNGAAVLVNRGWMSSANNGDVRPQTPAAAAGEVTVQGWVRDNGSGGSTKIADASTRALSATAFAEWVGDAYPVYGNLVALEKQTPAPATALGPTEMPDDTGDGPHFFYGLQWWFFGGLAVFGFLYLAYDERKRMVAARNQAATDSA